MADVFISYAREDAETAKSIAVELQNRGYSVWWDRKIPPGRSFDEVISQALDEAKCVIVLWSTTSVRSNWVKEEAAVGADRGILVPALIDEVPIPLGFGRIQTVDLSDWQGERDHRDLKFLAGAVAVVAGRTASFRPSGFTAAIRDEVAERPAPAAAAAPTAPSPPKPATPSAPAEPEPATAERSESFPDVSATELRGRTTMMPTLEKPAPRSGGLPLWLLAGVTLIALGAAVFFYLRSGARDPAAEPAAASAQPAEPEAATPTPTAPVEPMGGEPGLQESPTPGPADPMAATAEPAPVLDGMPRPPTEGDGIEVPVEGSADAAESSVDAAESSVDAAELARRGAEMLESLDAKKESGELDDAELLAQYETLEETLGPFMDEPAQAELAAAIDELRSGSRQLAELESRDDAEELTLAERMALWSEVGDARPAVREEASRRLAELQAVAESSATIDGPDRFVTCAGVARDADGTPTGPQGVGDRFPPGTVHVFAWVRSPDRETLRLEWREEGAVAQTQQVTVGRSTGYRIFYQKSFSDPGEKEVRLYNQAGVLIARREFVVG